MNKTLLVILVLVGIFVVSYVSADLIKEASREGITDRVAVIPIYGPIVGSGNVNSVFAQQSTPSQVIIDFIVPYV